MLRGQLAEQQVADWLQRRGWHVVERNFRARGGELDLVMRCGAALRLVEVKARAPGDPLGLEAVDRGKRRRLVSAARAFLAQYDEPWDEVCFAVALVEEDDEGWRVDYLDDAFDVG